MSLLWIAWQLRIFKRLDILRNLLFSENLLSPKIRDNRHEFKIGQSFLEQLLSYLFTSGSLEELRPVFRFALHSLSGW
jgi:hypothetical protein